jgi:hypothetical protein
MNQFMQYDIIHQIFGQTDQFNIEADIVFRRTTPPACFLVSDKYPIILKTVLSGQFFQPLNKDFFGFSPVYVVEVAGKFPVIPFRLPNLSKMFFYPVPFGRGKHPGFGIWHPIRHGDPNTFKGSYRNIDPRCLPAAFKENLSNALDTKKMTGHKIPAYASSSRL